MSINNDLCIKFLCLDDIEYFLICFYKNRVKYFAINNDEFGGLFHFYLNQLWLLIWINAPYIWVRKREKSSSCRKHWYLSFHIILYYFCNCTFLLLWLSTFLN